jgi:glycerate kinase
MMSLASMAGPVRVNVDGRDIAERGGALSGIASLDFSSLVPIPGGVLLLSDASAPLTGPTGAAVVFGPQKGANPEQVQELDQALAAFARLAGYPLHLFRPRGPGIWSLDLV